MSKILIVVERFYPEDFLVNDLVVDWIRRGATVEVLTQVPSYPFDRIYDGYENRRLQTTYEDLGVPPGARASAHVGPVVTVHRVNTIFGYNVSVRRKILNYLHFGWRTFWWAVWRGRKYDHVFVYHTAALTMAMASIPMRVLWHRPVTIWTQDLWPDAVWGFGFKPGPVKRFVLNSFVRLIYACCSRITVSCPGYVRRIKEICGREAEFVPQWDPAVASVPATNATAADKPIVFMFAGNLGVPQNLEHDIEGFLLADLPRAELWIVGGGVMLEALSGRYGHDRRIRFCGRQPRKEMSAWFAQADALIISLTEQYQLTLPGKFQSYLKTGKPLLGFIGGATRRFIEGEVVEGVLDTGRPERLGWTAPPGDVEGIAEAYRRMAASIRSGAAASYGEAAHRLSARMFDREALSGRLLGNMVQSGHGKVS